MDFGEIKILPGKKFDDLYAGKEFLKKFDALIGKHHSLLAGTKQEMYELGLYRYHDDEDSETGQSAWAQVDQEEGQTDEQLDWSSPGRVEILAGKVDTRDVGGDVVDEFSVGVDVPSTSGEPKSLVVDRGDQTCA